MEVGSNAAAGVPFGSAFGGAPVEQTFRKRAKKRRPFFKLSHHCRKDSGGALAFRTDSKTYSEQFNMTHPIYISTVLLEPNRWTAEKEPSFLVSDWLPRFAEAGFDGVELWQNHALQADAREQAALGNAPLPIPIFNSYAALGPDGHTTRAQTTEWVQRLDCRGVKFNVGKDPDRLEQELGTAVE